MKIKTSKLTGTALNWAVATCEGYSDLRLNPHAFDRAPIMTPPRKKYGPVYLSDLNYGGSWEMGGPIIEREGIELLCNVSNMEAKRFKDAHADWFACMNTSKHVHWHGPTPLIAAMRAFVAFKLGNEIEIPEELCQPT